MTSDISPYNDYRAPKRFGKPIISAVHNKAQNFIMLIFIAMGIDNFLKKI